MKSAILDRWTAWGIEPSGALIQSEKMGQPEIEAFRAARIATLLDADYFCDSARDDDVRAGAETLLNALTSFHQNNIIMFSNPDFIQLTVDFFYNADGIASRMPATFRPKIPLAGLVLIRTVVSNLLHHIILITQRKS